MSRLVLPVLALVCLWLAAPAAAQGVRRCTDARGNSVFTDRSCDSQGSVPSEGARSAFGTGNYGEGAYGPATVGSYASGFGRLGCARSPDRLLDGVRAALQARDVNRLASYYHWTGTGSRAGVHLMDSLEEIVARPLVSAELVFPFSTAPDPGFPPLGSPSADGAYQPSSGPTAGGDGFPRWGSPSPENAAPPESPYLTAAPDDIAPSANAGPPGSSPGPDQPPLAAGTDPYAAPVAPPAPRGPPPVALQLQQMAGDSDAGSRQTRFSLQRNAGCWWIEL